MCAYNVRRKRSADVEPPRGWSRVRHRLIELVFLAICAAVGYAVWLLARRFLH